MSMLNSSVDSSDSPAVRPRLAIPLGDPAGIGPEVVLKALASQAWPQNVEITLVGRREDLDLTQAALQAAGVAMIAPGTIPTGVRFDPILQAPEGTVILGQESALTGAISFAALDRAIDQTLAGQFDAIVTAPIAKSAWHAAGHQYPGQTEVLAARAGVTQFGMAFIAQSPHTDWRLRVLLASTHIPLRQVPDILTAELLTQKLALLVTCLQQDFGLATPTVAIAGLNPHSGEGGQLGREEVDWLIPWRRDQQARYPQVKLVGPVPPDTLWVVPGQAWFGTKTGAGKRAADGYLALYHDQGLIPVKLMGFDRAVNTTIGLPFVRTSPDHGTAFDIAGQGVANPTSMVAALQLAIELVGQRQLRHPPQTVASQNARV